MKITKIAVRYLLGVFLLVFGLNGFLQFIPMGDMVVPEQAQTFMKVFFGSGWGPIIKGIEVASGLLLILNLFVPATLIVNFAIALNAVIFHFLLHPATTGGAALYLILTSFLIITNLSWYKSILVLRPTE